jgi:hypothetical protein
MQVKKDSTDLKRLVVFANMAKAALEVIPAEMDLLKSGDSAVGEKRQYSSKVLEFQIAQSELDAKRREIAILSRQHSYVIVGGACGGVLGLLLAGFGFARWNRFERAAWQRYAAEARTAEATADKTAPPGLILPPGDVS